MSTVIKSDRTSTETVAIDGAGPYPIGFPLYDTDGIKVYVNGTERTDWTLSAAFSDGVADSPTITFLTSLTAGDEIIIDASLVPWREEDFIQGDGNFVQKLNVEMGKLWSSLAEIRRDAMRSIRGFAALTPVDGVNISSIAQAESYAVAAEASASEAEAAATLAQSAQENLFDAWRGPWLTATAYVQGDLVLQNGNTYLCEADHTSGTFSTDVGSGYWTIFAQKGDTGSGSGDVVAANAGSEYASVAGSFRSNLALPLSPTGKVTAIDILTYPTERGGQANIGTGVTNGPPDANDGDTILYKRFDANNMTIVWFRQDGVIFVNSKSGGAWSGWIEQLTANRWGGAGLTPMDKTSVYTFNTTYQNISVYEREHYIVASSTTTTGREIQISKDGTAWFFVGLAPSTANGRAPTYLRVPPGWYFRINGAANVASWVELI